MGMQEGPEVKIEINKQAQGQHANQVTILPNKPIGIVCGQAEDGHLPAITLSQPQNRWADDNARFFFHPKRLQSLVPAGRLDIDSIGLLALTQDGRVARQLIGEDSGMEKEYLVHVTYTGLNQLDPQPSQLVRMDDDDPVSTNVRPRCTRAVGL
jgi:23S rRNA pseudouridine2604 synthase